jgi:ATP-dependent protease ClpP protease subunit
MSSTTTRRPRASGQGAASTGLDYEMWLYGEVGWEILASQFLADLKGANGGPVSVFVNSPGGDLFEGLAMYEALTASAASVIAMAGDDVVMAPTAFLMAHDALTMTYGNEADHLKTAELLGQASDVIASIYAARAGGTTTEWRKVMRAETWYTASEAVAAGLADRVLDARPLTNRARQVRAQAAVSAPVERLGYVAAAVREGLRASGRVNSRIGLVHAGTRPPRPAARRAAPSAMATIRALRTVR